MPHHLLLRFPLTPYMQILKSIFVFVCVCVCLGVGVIIIFMTKVVINRARNGINMLRIGVAASRTREHLQQEHTDQHSTQEHSSSKCRIMSSGIERHVARRNLSHSSSESKNKPNKE
jgi:hypothetical protein